MRKEFLMSKTSVPLYYIGGWSKIQWKVYWMSNALYLPPFFCLTGLYNFFKIYIREKFWGVLHIFLRWIQIHFAYRRCKIVRRILGGLNIFLSLLFWSESKWNVYNIIGGGGDCLPPIRAQCLTTIWNEFFDKSNIASGWISEQYTKMTEEELSNSAQCLFAAVLCRC